MKQKVVYVCEFCGSEDKKYFESQSECEEHEATHFRLTKEEYNMWNLLCTCAVDAGKRRGCCNNERTRKKFDTAVENLVQFEVEHNLTHVVKPKQFYL